MLAELIDGTADTDLCLIVALILAFVLCVYRAYKLRSVDGAIVAAIIFFLIFAWLVRA